ncbi:bacterial extracellular solute-binding protein, family 3 [Treponema primitia ZAS-2]|uniref:Bacterial extracellular solute-binding protein, family 3 n=1 Tax=Treponema primitia (strain ATCC BAA-887 / DSM 12427 / ZAS-2) TaxID=545694 RepID=F5YK78_TREPZ|nr:transporter substrate-binding domain-containing protein [Treponema primitia]AEF86485.1 bacterial extracellular solute-binding protein, family 3 [Treponema primitia ZAS-2]
MKKLSIRVLCIPVMVILGLFLFTGCNTKNKAAEGPKEVLIGVHIGSPLFFYLDDNDEFGGVEDAILKLIDEKLPEYTFKYEILEFTTILTSLDIGSIDMGCYLFEYTEERSKSYLFSTEGYLDFANYISVPKGAKGITTLDDLQGKKVGTWPSGNMAHLLESYNQEHSKTPIDIVYVNSNDIMITNFNTKSIEASLMTRWEVMTHLATRGFELELVGEPVSISDCYYLFPKDRTELQTAVDRVLRELKASGELERTIQKALDDYAKIYS